MLLGCVDKTNGHLDEDDDGCDYYENAPEDCGCCDTNQFTANTMCCACKDISNSRNNKIH